MGSGVALRLWRVGFRVLVLESTRPVAVRRTVAFAEAIYAGAMQVEEVAATRVESAAEAEEAWEADRLPVLADPEGASLRALHAFAVIDAIMAKRNTGTHMDLASLTMGLGPGFRAGSDVHAVVETNRGPHLGRVIWNGQAEMNTGEPGAVGGHRSDRVLRAPRGGILRTARSIGEIVDKGDVLATVDDQPVAAAFRSLLRGLARDGLQVHTGMKIGDLDPRLDPILCHLVSDKALAVAGGVLEAVFMSMNPRAR